VKPKERGKGLCEKNRPTNLKYKLDDVSRGMGVETYTHGKRDREVGKKTD
jgi:hypothetical protein